MFWQEVARAYGAPTRGSFYGDSTCLFLEPYIEADEDYMVEALRRRLSECVFIKIGVLIKICAFIKRCAFIKSGVCIKRVC